MTAVKHEAVLEYHKQRGSYTDRDPEYRGLLLENTLIPPLCTVQCLEQRHLQSLNKKRNSIYVFMFGKMGKTLAKPDLYY